MRTLVLIFVCVVAPFTVCSASTPGKVEPTGAFADASVSESIRSSLESTGYRVLLPDRSVQCEIWFRSSIPITAKADRESAYAKLTASELLGVIRFPKAATDFRGQPLKAGAYSLRYELLPEDGNHLGVAPGHDFVLLVPLAADKDPKAGYRYEELVRLSKDASGGSHPAPLLLMSPPPDAQGADLSETSEGWLLFTAKLKTSTADRLLFALVIKGAVEQ